MVVFARCTVWVFGRPHTVHESLLTRTSHCHASTQQHRRSTALQSYCFGGGCVQLQLACWVR